MTKSQVITENPASQEACRDWTLDQCPVCRLAAMRACRCAINHRVCFNGHSWYRDENGFAVMAGHSEGSALGPRPGVTEHGEQQALIDWVQANLTRLPQLHMLFAIPNGGERPATLVKRSGKMHRVSFEAVRLKEEGVREGVPDLCLAYPVYGIHGMRHPGLFIEMKRPTGKPSVSQLNWLEALHRLHYATAVCYSTEDAIGVIEEYLRGDAPQEDMPWPPWNRT